MSLESPVQRDGDNGFIGFASRINPLSLPAGLLQESVNMRLDRGVARTRKGVKRLAGDISVSGTPLTIPFILNAAPNEPVVRNIYSGGVYASAMMLLPEESISTEAVVLAGPDSAFTYITDSALEVDAAGAGAVLAVDGSDNLVTDTADELYVLVLPQQINFPTAPAETVEPTDKVSMLQAYDRMYLFREADRTQVGWGQVSIAAAGIAVSGTTATVNVDSHGYPQGARVRIEGGTSAAYDGHEYDIETVVNSDAFTITVPNGTPSEAISTLSVRRVKAPLYWSTDSFGDFVRASAGVPAEGPTYRKMRSVPWATYINNRLILPDGRQNVMISDVLDPNLYDPFWASFRVGKGGNDFIVAVHPWVDGTALVFCRKSIWLANIAQVSATGGNGFDIDTTVSKLELLTDEIGCAARRTIATAGQYVYFLSDSGVYRLDARLDLKLRGDTRPLSEPIADKLQSLNTDLIEDSVAVYQNNRYYLAVPLAGSTDNNNGVFIYSQLNEQWESQDLYGFGVGNFLSANVGGERRLMISNRAGKLMLLDQVEGGDESADSQVSAVSSVTGRIRTRRFDFGDMHSKRFLRTIADVVIPAGASVASKIATINPDTETTIGTLINSAATSEDYNMKSPVRYKAHSAEIIYETSNGRPEIRSASIEASPKSLPPTETRNAA
jgi:hypothetical protein